jgi:hypothetical protein
MSTPTTLRRTFGLRILPLALALTASVGCASMPPPAEAPSFGGGLAPPTEPPASMPADAPVGAAEEPIAAGPAPAPPPDAAAPARERAPQPTAVTASSPKKTSADGGDREVQAAPLIVYEGELALLVDSGRGSGAIDELIELAESMGGHLAGRDEGKVALKIPSKRFREAMSSIDKTFQVQRRNVRAEDVTAEFRDLEVRLENLRSTRKRLEQLMEKAGSLADTLSVEKELERVAGEIDRIQGRLRFLRAFTSFSKLTVTVTEKPKADVVVVKDGKGPRRELELPMPWVDRIGVPALLEVPYDD